MKTAKRFLSPLFCDDVLNTLAWAKVYEQSEDTWRGEAVLWILFSPSPLRSPCKENYVGYYEGKSLEKMTIKDLRIVLDKAKVGHAQIKLKKDLIAAVGRLPPRPGDTTAEDAAAAAAADAAAAAAAEAAAAAAADAAAEAALAGAVEEGGGDGAPTNEAFNQMLEGLTQGLTQHTKGLQGSIQDLGSSILADRQYEKGSSSIVDPTRARELTALRAGLLDTWAGGSSGSGSGCRRHLLGNTASVTFPLLSSDGERDQYMTFVWSVQGSCPRA